LPDYFKAVTDILASYIENKVDYFTMQFSGGHYKFGPYVQALHENGNMLLIEAIGNEYLEPPLPEANQQIMLFLGWGHLGHLFQTLYARRKNISSCWLRGTTCFFHMC